MGKGLYSPHAWLLLAVPLLSGYRCYIYRLFRAKGLPFQLVEFDGRSDYGPFISQDVFIPGVWYDFSLSPLLSSPLLSSFSPPPPPLSILSPLPSSPALSMGWCFICAGCAGTNSCRTNLVHSQDDPTTGLSLRQMLTYQVEETAARTHTAHAYQSSLPSMLLLLLLSLSLSLSLLLLVVVVCA